MEQLASDFSTQLQLNEPANEDEHISTIRLWDERKPLPFFSDEFLLITETLIQTASPPWSFPILSWPDEVIGSIIWVSSERSLALPLLLSVSPRARKLSLKLPGGYPFTIRSSINTCLMNGKWMIHVSLSAFVYVTWFCKECKTWSIFPLTNGLGM